MNTVKNFNNTNIMKKILIIIMISLSQVCIAQDPFEPLIESKKKTASDVFNMYLILDLYFATDDNSYIDIGSLEYIEVNPQAIITGTPSFDIHILYILDAEKYGVCEKYIILFNTRNDRTYRLKGFHQNDLMFLIRDLQQEHYDRHGKKLRKKRILKRLSMGLLEEVDIMCIYKGLKSIDKSSNVETEYDKYPCLDRCNDPRLIQISNTK